MTRDELPFIMSNPGKVASTVIVVGAVGLVAVALETLRMRMNGWLALAVVSIVLLVMALMIHPAFPHDHNEQGIFGDLGQVLCAWLNDLKVVRC